ncbi:DUF5058 family protein [Agromyces sp. LHK192]|uniref:DUF5058 family protein n=1 Tax=Agromyces sp. LHK192 TaxID=2498704 RepID=UPI000FDB0FAF|nr:DUF5058 family protein [Agromyces sp. LHK192]
MSSTIVVAASGELTAVAFHPVMWAMVVGVFGVIILQSVIYLRAIRRSATAAELSQGEVTQAVKTGAVAAIGPSLAVALVALSLLPLFGTPAVLTRVGLVGSATYDVASAGIAAATQGASLGGETYTPKVFAIAFAAMTMGGLVWMLTALILTPILSKGGSAIRKMPKVNPKVLAAVPMVILPLAFVFLIVSELGKSPFNGIVLLVSAVVGTLCALAAKFWNLQWLREWGLGISIFASLIVGYLISTAL